MLLQLPDLALATIADSLSLVDLAKAACVSKKGRLVFGEACNAQKRALRAEMRQAVHAGVWNEEASVLSAAIDGAVWATRVASDGTWVFVAPVTPRFNPWYPIIGDPDSTNPWLVGLLRISPVTFVHKTGSRTFVPGLRRTSLCTSIRTEAALKYIAWLSRLPDPRELLVA